MSAPVAATADTAVPVPDSSVEHWDSTDGTTPDTRETSVEVGDWRGDSSSRDLPSEEAMRRSLGADPAPASREFEGDADGSGPNTADDAVAAENARREAEAAGETKPAKKSKPLEQRVEKMRERLDRTRFEVGQEERRLEAIRAEVAALEAKRTQPAADGAPPPPDKQPTWKDYDEAGKDFDEFLAARDSWVLAQADRRLEEAKRRELASAEAEHSARRHETFREAVAARVDTARAAHEDFDDAIVALQAIKSEDAPFLHDAIALHDQGGEIMYFLAKNLDTVAKPLMGMPLTHPMFDALRETSAPTEMLGYFAANPKEVERISRLSPASALVALGRLVAQVENAPAGSFLPPSSTTKAVPPPAARVDGSRRVAGPRSGPDPEAPPGGWDVR